MGSRENSDDEDFSELYKEYTGPLGSKNGSYDTSQERLPAIKRSHSEPEEEEDARDPNAVPTDFTSREAKVWEAKSKATERNWKKRKEEEFICKICGESGHFTQGCPSTLGASRKSQDFFERVAAREPHMKALFNEKVVSELEKDIGCKIKIEEKFIIVSGKDRLVLKKGVDAVHKIKEEGEKKGSSSSLLSRSRSPERRSPVTSRLGRSDSQRSNPSPQGPQRGSYFQNRTRQDKVMEDGVREDLLKPSRPSPKAAVTVRDLERRCLTNSSFGEAYGNEGVRRQSSHSRSPARPLYQINTYNSFDGHSQGRRGYRAEGWDTERRSSDMQFEHKFDHPAFPNTLEELEIEYAKEAMELARMRDKEEDEENYRHREAMRQIRESYMKKLANLRESQAKQWDELLEQNAQKRQPQVVQQHMPGSGFVGGHKQSGYHPEYDNPTGNHHYSESSVLMDSRGRYPSPMGNSYNSSRPQRAYDDFQHQRRDDYGKAYNRY